MEAQRQRNIRDTALLPLSHQLLRIPSATLIARERCFSVELRGEGAQDLGGPYAEALSAVCDDLRNSRLFVPSNNARSGVGDGRDFTSSNPLLRDLLLPAASIAPTRPIGGPAAFWTDDAVLGAWGYQPLDSHQNIPVPALLSQAPPLILSPHFPVSSYSADAAAGSAAPVAGGPVALLQQQLQYQQRAYAQLLGYQQEGDDGDDSSSLLRFWGVKGLSSYGQRVCRALQAIGLLMGCASLSLSPLNISLTPAIWTLLIGEQPPPELLLQQDLLAAKHLRRLQAPIAAAAAAAVAARSRDVSPRASPRGNAFDTSADPAAQAAAAAAADAAAAAAAAIGESEEEAREEAAAAVYALLQRGACIDDSVGRPLPLLVNGDCICLRPEDLSALLSLELQAKVRCCCCC